MDRGLDAFRSVSRQHGACECLRQPHFARMTASLLVRRLGRQPYQPVLAAMRAFADQRDAETNDELWVLQHEPVFTLGQAGKWEHVLMPGDIPVVPVDRGGQVTYHGPGQIVAYPLIDIRRANIGVREFVNRIEQSIIDTLDTWNIVAVRARRAGRVRERRKDWRHLACAFGAAAHSTAWRSMWHGPGAVSSHQSVRVPRLASDADDGLGRSGPSRAVEDVLIDEHLPPVRI